MHKFEYIDRYRAAWHFFFVGLVTKLPIYSAEADQATDSIERSNSLQRSLSLQP